MSLLSILSKTASLALFLTMSIRDIRSREVLGRDLVLLAFFSLMSKALSGPSSPGPESFPPPWLSQFLDLVQGSLGGLVLLLLALTIRLVLKKEYLGLGDGFFALAAGLGMSPQESLFMVILAFLLAFPPALILALKGKKEITLPLVPFLSLAVLWVRQLPLPVLFFSL